MPNKSYKGRKFELWIAAELSKWWTNGERDDVFYHTHMSGGRATTRAKKGKTTKNFYGDIYATDPIGQPLMDLLVIECKKGYNKYTIADLLDKPDGAAKQEYEKWFEQAEESRKQAGVKYWLVIHKRDRREALVFYKRNLLEHIGEDSNWYIPTISLGNREIAYNGCAVPQKSATIEGTWLSIFLGLFKPEYFIEGNNGCAAP